MAMVLARKGTKSMAPEARNRQDIKVMLVGRGSEQNRDIVKVPIYRESNDLEGMSSLNKLVYVLRRCGYIDRQVVTLFKRGQLRREGTEADRSDLIEVNITRYCMNLRAAVMVDVIHIVRCYHNLQI
jgi:hypothetical protein